MERKSAWETWDDVTKQKALRFCDEYREFLSLNKTERKCCAYFVREAEERGFKPVSGAASLAPGDKVYKVNRGKQVVFCVLGNKPLREGMRVIVSHIDVPRIDLKANPLYEDESFALLKTCYYGGLKKYHWFALPLALYGVVMLKSGEARTIEIGDGPGEPVFTITDLLPHLAKDQMKKSIEEGFAGELLNILVGNIPAAEGEKEKIKRAVTDILEKEYGIREDDFISGEFQAVPAGPARDLGFDRSMLIGYGQDDRVCAFTSFRALPAAERPEYTTFCILADQEEIGSRGSTSAQSAFFRFLLEEIMEKSGGSASDVKYCLERSKAISADVESVIDPTYKEVHDARNAARMGNGVVLTRTTGARGKSSSTEPSAEYLFYMRTLFDEGGIVWQPGELGKVEQGGGGTVATYLALLNMDTVDCGVGVLSMHAPFEVTGKADVYSAYCAYSAFYRGGGK